jgi:hypothetical protein
MLDLAVREAAMRGLGIIWRSRGHWGHAHFDISTNRRIGNMVYATLDGTPPVKALDGSPGQVGTPGASSGSEQQMGVALFRAFTHVQDWMASGVSDILGGPRALMNDVPFLQTVGELLSAGLRDWCSAPNGDLIAWFPDYFGRFGTAARMVIEPIEILGDGFEVEWSDDRLKTHMFVTSSDDLGGSWINPPTTATSLHRMMTTAAGHQGLRRRRQGLPEPVRCPARLEAHACHLRPPGGVLLLGLPVHAELVPAVQGQHRGLVHAGDVPRDDRGLPVLRGAGLCQRRHPHGGHDRGRGFQHDAGTDSLVFHRQQPQEPDPGPAQRR